MHNSTPLISKDWRERLHRTLRIWVAVSVVFQSSLSFVPISVAQAATDSSPVVENAQNNGIFPGPDAETLAAQAVEPVLAADSGWLDPTSNSVLNTVVTDPANAYAEDSADAVFDSSSSAKYGTFGISLPVGALLSGIEVKTRTHRVSGDGDKNFSVSLSWNNGSNWSSASATTDTDADYVSDVLGGPTNTWGHSWTSGQLADGQFVVRVQDSFDSGTAGLDHVAIKVHYTTVESNPDLPQACGLDLALVIDSSGSISTTELTQMKNAYKAFVDAFLPGTPTQMSVVEYDTNVVGPTLAFTNNITNIKNDIDAAVSGGWTNWEAGLLASHNTYDPRPAKPDLMLFASDGNPNTVGVNGNANGGAAGEAAALAAAVTRANAIKADGIRILALGIGDELNVANLQAVSGPNVNTGVTSDVITSSFDTLAADLAELANDLCGGKILVQKMFDTDGDGQADLDGTNPDPALAGWQFDVDGAPSNPGAQTTTNTGSLEFSVLNGTYSVTEENLLPNTALVSAECVMGQAPVGSFNPNTATVSGLTLTTDQTIACTFLNQVSNGTLRVVKNVVGGSAQSSNWQIHVEQQGTDVTNSPQPGTAAGTSYELTPGAYHVSETGGPSGYTLAYSGDCDAQGNVTVAAGASATCTLTNTRDTGTITVRKNVDTNGDGQVDQTNVTHWAWDIASGEQNIATGQGRTLPTGSYTISEDMKPGYHVTDLMCDGANLGAVTQTTLQLDKDETIVCTFTNTRDTGTVIVHKSVDTDGNGSFDGNDATANNLGFRWQLDGGSDRQMGSPATLVPTGNHTLTENAVSGYEFVGWYPTGSTQYSCANPYSTDASIAIDLGANQTSEKTFCNARQTGGLTVLKAIDTDGDGDIDQWNTGWTWDLDGGNQSFAMGSTESVPTGQHAVKEDQQANYHSAGWVCVDSETQDSLGNGQGTELTVDVSAHGATCTFTNVRDTGSITGTKFNDLNGNGAWNQGEPGLPGWTIQLSNGASTLTDADGNYEFASLPTGTYTVTELGEAGWMSTTPNPVVNVAVTANETTTVNFGNFEQFDVIVCKKVDTNGDGDVANDPYFMGAWTMSLQTVSPGGKDTNQEFTQGLLTQDTSEGCTTFSNVGPGRYTVSEEAKSGWTQTSPASGTYAFDSESGLDRTYVFGNFQLGKISGHKFEDRNGNSAWDQGEPALAGWTIWLDNAASTQTDANGYYEFDGLAVGTYTVSEELEDSWTQTAPLSPGTYTVPVVSGTAATDQNFGNFHNVSVRVCKKVDTNGDGDVANDPFYDGQGGWAVSLQRDQNGPMTQYTDEGCTTFVNLGPGNYTGSEESKDGWVQTYPVSGTHQFTAQSGQGRDLVFGNFQTPRLTVIKHVVNNNGGTAVAGNFTMVVDGSDVSDSSFPGDEAGTTVTLNAGAYSVDETGGPSGYSKQLSEGCSGTVQSGDQPVCTITNNDIQPKLTVTKVVINNNGGNAVVADFPLFVSQTPVTSGAQNGFDAGAYVVSETNLPGYAASFSGDCSAQGNVTLNIGEVKSCTITNNDIAPTIKLIKAVDNKGIPGRTAGANDFGLTIGGTAVASGHVLPVNASTPYALNEAVVPGYVFVSLTGEGCPAALGGTVTLTEGQNVVCTIRNDAVAPSLTLTKSDSPDPVAAGQLITYTMNWSVTGAVATTVVLTDTIPANTTFVSVADGGVYTAATNSVSWNLGNQSPGATGVVHFTVRAASPISNGTVVTNTAFLKAVELATPISATATTTVASGPSLSLIKTENVAEFVNPGQTVTYTIVVTNAAGATDTAHAVTVTDTLPAGLTYGDGTTTKTYGPFELAPGASQTISETVTVTAIATSGNYVNTAKAKGSNTPEVTATATFEVRVPQVLATVTLTIDKTVDDVIVNPGQTISYTLKVTNTSVVAAENVTITDQLPTGFTFVDGGGRNKVFVVATILPGQTEMLTYKVLVDKTVKAGVHQNIAIAEADNAPPVTDVADVTVRTVKVLAATGASARDFAMFAFGLLLMLVGALGYQGARRETGAVA